MKKFCMKLFIFMTLILSLLTPISITANSAEPPGIEIIVTDAPEDLTLTFVFANGETEEPLVVRRDELKSVYFFYYTAYTYGTSFEHIKLKVSSKNYNFTCDLPSDTNIKYKNKLILDIKGQSLRIEDRSIYLLTVIFMRVLLTFLIEGSIFYLFGYHKMRSWLIFLFTNLFTQGMLNYIFNTMVTTPDQSGSLSMVYLLFEISVIVIECFIFSFLVNEHSRIRGFKYALYANLISLFLGGAIMVFIPY